MPGSHPPHGGRDELRHLPRAATPCAVANTGSPPQLFQASIPVVVVGHFTSRHLAPTSCPTSIMVKHSANYIAAVPGPGEGEERDRPLMRRTRALGTIGVWLAFVGQPSCGAVVIVVGLVRQARDAGRSPARHRARPRPAAAAVSADGRLFAPVMLVGAVLAVVRHGARAGHPRLHASSSWPRTTARSRRCSTPSPGMWSALAGLHPAVGPRPRRGLDHLRLALPPARRPTRSSAGPPWCSTSCRAFFFGLMVGPANPFVTAPGVHAGPRARTRSSRTTRWWPSTRRSSTSASSASPCPSPSPSACWPPGRVGDRWQIECRRWTLVAFTFLSVGIVLGAWWSVPGARAGAASGAGTRSRTRPSCRGCAARPTCTRCWCRSGAASCGCGTSRSRSPPSPSPSSAPSSPARASSTRCTPSPSRRSGPILIGFFFVVVIVGLRAHRLARRPAALAGRDRRAARARGRVPAQQRALRRLRLRRAARHRVPAALRGGRPSSRSPSARPSSTRWPSRSAWPCSSSWPWRRC